MPSQLPLLQMVHFDGQAGDNVRPLFYRTVYDKELVHGSPDIKLFDVLFKLFSHVTKRFLAFVHTQTSSKFERVVRNTVVPASFLGCLSAHHRHEHLHHQLCSWPVRFTIAIERALILFSALDFLDQSCK